MGLDKVPAAQAAAAARPLPGVQPVVGPWITVTAAYEAQVTEKAALIAQGAPVIAALPEARLDLLWEGVLAGLAEHPDFDLSDTHVRCPDGRVVALDAKDPLLTFSKILQEDLCLMERKGDAHVLTAALLAFPANWTLAEKIGKPLLRIHKPVDAYDAGLGARVQRLFDGVQMGRPLWRANLLREEVADLFTPRSEDDPRHCVPDDAPFLRSERQTILRLGPGVVLFAIHTTVALRSQPEPGGIQTHPPGR